MLLVADRTDLAPATFVAQHGEVFAVFDSATQDSGNVSYGVRVGGEKLFVKTAGSPTDGRPFLPHDARVALLRNAVRLAGTVSDAAMPPLRNVIESIEGPMLVYEWVEGELVGTTRSRRSDPSSAFARFRALPLVERAAALDTVFRLHVILAARRWIASDFYDGCLIYDFANRAMHVVDLDHYRDAPFMNEMGRMFGSSRFMAPEEHERGARIDHRTTVYAMGRTVEQFLSVDGHVTEGISSLISRACHADPERRFDRVENFYRAWSGITPLHARDEG
jgi:serine/threonine-protein kinase